MISDNPQQPQSALSSLNLSELSVLRAIVEGTAQAIGENFFQLLVGNLCLATGVDGAFVAEFVGDKSHVRSLAYWMDGQII